MIVVKAQLEDEKGTWEELFFFDLASADQVDTGMAFHLEKFNANLQAGEKPRKLVKIISVQEHQLESIKQVVVALKEFSVKLMAGVEQSIWTKANGAGLASKIENFVAEPTPRRFSLIRSLVMASPLSAEYAWVEKVEYSKLSKE